MKFQIFILYRFLFKILAFCLKYKNIFNSKKVKFMRNSNYDEAIKKFFFFYKTLVLLD